MNICTVGTSWITDSFIESAKYVKDINITDVYSRSADKAEKFAEKHGIKNYYCNFSDMLCDKTIDGVYVASPNLCHYEQSKAILESGKNVICEKPAAVTTSQLSELYDLAEKKGLIFLEAMKSMHSDGLQIIKDALPSLGDVRSASIDFSQLSSKYPAYKKGELPNIFNPKMCTGALMDLGVYCVYFALELFGEPKKVISHSDFLSSGADSSGTLIFAYGDKTVTVTYSKTANGFLGSRILGANGALSIKSVSKLIGIKKHENDGTVSVLYPDVDENIIMSKEIQSFYDFVAGDRLDYYDYCKKLSLAACRIMEQVRKDNNFGF